MEKSLDFYCNVLGLSRVFDLSHGDKPWIIYLKVCGGQFIELFYTGPEETVEQANSASYTHLCLEVFDIHEACESIKSKGYPLTSEPVQGIDLNMQAWVADPDGNRIELMQINENSPQAKA
jgi:lactoylglutathione lyase